MGMLHTHQKPGAEPFTVLVDDPALDLPFILFGLLSLNTVDWVAYNQQKLISHSAGSARGWKVQDKLAGRFGVW